MIVEFKTGVTEGAGRSGFSRLVLLIGYWIIVAFLWSERMSTVEESKLDFFTLIRFTMNNTVGLHRNETSKRPNVLALCEKWTDVMDNGGYYKKIKFTAILYPKWQIFKF